MAVQSTNGDLWKEVFQHIETKKLEFQLIWVPSHLNTKPEKAKGKVIPQLHFAANYIADHFAGLAANRVEVDRNVAVEVVSRYFLVKKIQLRIVNILELLERKNSEQRPDKHKVAAFPKRELAELSDHALVYDNGLWTCVNCRQALHTSAPWLKHWFSSICKCIVDDTAFPIRIDPLNARFVGRTIPHSSHDLYSFKGLTYCCKCGYYAE